MCHIDPKDSQPTAARWVSVDEPPPELLPPTTSPVSSEAEGEESSATAHKSSSSIDAPPLPTRLLHGTRVGVGAWGLAVVRTVMEIDEPLTERLQQAERNRILEEAAREDVIEGETDLVVPVGVEDVMEVG